MTKAREVARAFLNLILMPVSESHFICCPEYMKGLADDSFKLLLQPSLQPEFRTVYSRRKEQKNFKPLY